MKLPKSTIKDSLTVEFDPDVLRSFRRSATIAKPGESAADAVARTRAENEARKPRAKQLRDYMKEHVAENGANPSEAGMALGLLEPILYLIDWKNVSSLGLSYAPEDNDGWEWIVDSFGENYTRIQVVIHFRYPKQIDVCISGGNPGVAVINLGLNDGDYTSGGGDLLIKAACQWFNERTKDVC